MTIYLLTDDRNVDRYEDLLIFLKLEDAIAQKNSMKDESKFFQINEIEVIK